MGPPDPSSRLAARAACRWLRDAYDSCNTHLELVEAAVAGEKGKTLRQSYHALRRLISRTSKLSSLHITDWENGGELLKLPVHWGQLRVLDLSGLPCRNDLYSASGKPKPQAVGPLADCSALEELVIFSGCLFMGEPDTLPFSSALRSLRLLNSSNSKLGSIAPLFPALQQLELEGSEDKLDVVNIAACTGLRQLRFWLDHFDNINNSMSSLTSLTQLTSLKLYECGDLMDLQAIALLSSLRHLELKDAGSITDISPLGSLRSSLERLVIMEGLGLVASSSGPCLSACTLLRHLDLSGSCEVEEDDAFDLSALSACIFLEHLDLTRNFLVAGSMEARSCLAPGCRGCSLRVAR